MKSRQAQFPTRTNLRQIARSDEECEWSRFRSAVRQQDNTSHSPSMLVRAALDGAGS